MKKHNFKLILLIMIFFSGVSVLRAQGTDCATAIPLNCGVSVSGSTVGSTSMWSNYSSNCGLQFTTETGPEIFYSVTTTSVGDLTATLSNTSNNDLDVVILSGCDQDSCLNAGVQTAGMASATVAAAPIGTYLIVVEGYDGASGTFDLLVTSTGTCASAFVCDAGAMDPTISGGDTIQYCPGTSISFGTDGTENTSDASLTYQIAIQQVNNSNIGAAASGNSYTGDLNQDIVNGGEPALPAGLYIVAGYWTDLSSIICEVSPIDYIYLNILDGTDPLCAVSCDPGDVDPVTSATPIDYCPGTSITLSTDGNEVPSSATDLYGWAFFDTTTLGFIFGMPANTGSTYSGDLNADLGQLGESALPTGTYYASGVWFDETGVTCGLLTANTYILNVLEATDPLCAPTPMCAISNLAQGTQTACDPATNTYTQQVIVTYMDPPGSGMLTVNGQNFGITSSPQTVTLTGLPANGATVSVAAAFTADLNCSAAQANLFTAPAPCNNTPVCMISNLAQGPQTACDPSTNTYTQQVIVTYENAPVSGNLVVNGQVFPLAISPQTVTLTDLVADGNPVTALAAFSAEPNCMATQTNLFVAPAACDDVGIGELEVSDLQLYPNPTEDMFTVSFETNTTMDIRFGLYNVVGKLMTQEVLTNQNGQVQQTFSTSSYAPGVYFMEIYGNNSKQVLKVIVQK